MRKFFNTLWRIITAPFRFIFWIFKRIFIWIKNVFQDIGDLFVAEPEDKPITDTVSVALDEPQEFWWAIIEHLDALRKHLFRALIVIILAIAAVAFFVGDLLDWISQPIGGIDSLQAIEVTEPLGVVMRVVLLAGFALALPYITLELYLFIAPGLKVRARIFGLLSIPVAFLFFVGGMAFAYFVMMPTALPFLLNFMDIPTAVRPASYIKFVTGLMFWIGIAFEFPLVIFGDGHGASKKPCPTMAYRSCNNCDTFSGDYTDDRSDQYGFGDGPNDLVILFEHRPSLYRSGPTRE